MADKKKAPKLGDTEKKDSSLARMYYEESRKPATPEDIAAAVQPQVGYEDMTKMEDMNEVTLLKNVKDRYDADLIYTYCSAILVALNPFKFLPIYDQAWVMRYKGHRLGIQHPHLYAISEASYSTMADRHEDVSVIISGESGAGKTECTKLLLRFLAARMDKVSKTEAMLLETVPILDVLGNAKTVRNDNSSRFGKYIEIIFDSNNFIAGSKIMHYLLEKSRIVYQAEGERNFHFFYQIAEGSTDEDRALTKAKHANDYKFLNQSGCISIPKVDEAKDLKSTKKAFTLFGIDQETQDSIMKLVSAVLYMGNINFKNNGQSVSVVADAQSDESLAIAAQLINLKKEDLLAGVRTKRLNVRGEITIVELNAEKSRDSCEALGKALYALNFDWVIRKINESLFADKYTSRNFIGVLDIFGFENFKFNSLEQLLINFANEKLQKFFNHHIFSMEQEEYEKEKIDWKQITFKDNQECLDLIEKKPSGILCYLDEECRFPKATDKSFLEKVNQNCEKHPYFQKLKIVRTTFKVLHYAGLVEYDVTGWLDKNKDELPDHTIEMLEKCPNAHVSTLFKPDPEIEKLLAKEGGDGGGAKKKSNKITVGGQFKLSLTALTEKMMATAPYFVRCIKPNMAKSPNNFVSDDVQAQLKYAGMLETIRIRRLGYPIRYLFKEFYQRYKCLVHSQYHSSGDFEARCVGMLPHINLPAGTFQKGITKVFLKQEAANTLEDRRAIKLGEVILIAQSWYRMIYVRKAFREKRDASIVLETWFRARNTKKSFFDDQEAAKQIQNTFRVAKAVMQKKKLLEKKRQEEEELRRKREEERQKKVAAGKMSAAEAAAEAEREANLEAAELLEAVKKGKKRMKGMDDDAARLEAEARERELLEKAPTIDIPADTTIYCPATAKIALKWTSDKVVDLDVSAVVLDKNGQVLDVCYYNQKETGDNACKLSQDDRLGEKTSGDNECITIEFGKLVNYGRFIAFCISCYSDGYTLTDASNPSFEFRDGPKVLFSTNITEDPKKAMDGKTKHTAFIPAVAAKSGEKWVCKPYEKLTNGMRWMEVLPSIQKLLVDDKLIPPIEEEKPFPKPFRSIKGEEIVITSNITKLLCGLGWVGNEDLDLAVLMFRYKEFVDHIDPVRHNKSKDGSVFHKGDAKTGKGTDDEKIYVDLDGISRRVNELFFLVTVFNSGGGGGFAKVKDAHVRLVDATNFKEINDPDKEITRFTLSRTCGNRSAQIMCKLWRVGPSKWNVIAMGEPSSGLFYEHLIPKVQPFLDEAPPMRTFQVTIHSGKNLPADLLPYFRVRFDRDSAKTKQLKKPKQKFKEVVIISGEATAMDIGIFNKKLGKDKFFGQIFVPVDKDFKKKSFKLEDRGKKKEKVAAGAELSISLENITGSPAALQTQEANKKKK